MSEHFSKQNEAFKNSNEPRLNLNEQDSSKSHLSSNLKPLFKEFISALNELGQGQKNGEISKKPFEILFKHFENDAFDLEQMSLECGFKSEDFLKEYAKFKKLELVNLNSLNALNLNENLAHKIPLKKCMKHSCAVFKEDESFFHIAFIKAPNLELLEDFTPFLQNKQFKIYLASALEIAQFNENLDFQVCLKCFKALIYNELDNKGFDEKSGVHQLFNLVASKAIRLRASDIHFEPFKDEGLVRLRIDGLLSIFLRLELQIYQALIFYIKLLAHLNVAEQRRAQDGSFVFSHENNEFDFRVSSLPLIEGESLVLRILERKKEFLSLENLHFESQNLNLLKKSIKAPFGLILLTGPTGSGKSTTLYASLNEIKDESKKIITAEDPIEYRLDLVQQIKLNEKAEFSFENALRAILRQDPDVIMIGEIRDEQSLDIAIKAALTGHLVFSTLHTNDALSAIWRMMDMRAKPYLLANALELIIAQRLVRKLCAHCKFKKYDASFRGEFYSAKGCEYCNHSGYKGRELIEECLFIDENLSELIRGEASKKKMQDYLTQKHFKSMFELGLDKAKAGITSLEEILRVIR